MEGGDGEDFGESHGFQGGTEGGGDQLSPTGYKWGAYRKFTVKLSANEGGNHKNKNEQSLMGDQVNVFLIQPKSPPPSPPPPLDFNNDQSLLFLKWVLF